MSAKMSIKSNSRPNSGPDSRNGNGISLYQITGGGFVEPDRISYRQWKYIRIGDYFMSFFNETSMQGFPQLVRSGGILKKFMWIMAIVLCALGLYWQLSGFFIKLFKWKAVTSIDFETARMLPFPAVTLCNDNPTWITEDVVNALEEEGAFNSTEDGALEAVMKKRRKKRDLLGTLTEMNADYDNYSSYYDNNAAGAASFSYMAGAPVAYDNDDESSGEDMEMSRDFVVVQKQIVNRYRLMERVLTNFGLKNIYLIGHQLCDMVIKCVFDSKPCRIDQDFKAWHWNSEHGNCFTFNLGHAINDNKSSSNDFWERKMGKNKDGIKWSKRIGEKHGLYLLLNSDLERYPNTSTGQGWRVVIHDQRAMPFPEEEGIAVAPGRSTKIAVSKVVSKRLSTISNAMYTAKYSDCLEVNDYDDKANRYRSGYGTVMEVGYSSAACYKTCYQRAVLRNCSCYDVDYPNKGEAFDGIPQALLDEPCYFTQTDQWSCKEMVYNRFIQQLIECDCPESCEETNYKTQVSSLKWPNAKSVVRQCEGIASTLVNRAKNNDAMCQSKSYIRDYFNPNKTVYGDSDEPTIELFNDLIDCIRNDDNEMSDLEKLAQMSVGNRFGEIHIYYKDFQVETVEENENVSLEDVVGYFGGIMGLFFGFSLMTLFEYFELVMDLIFIAFAKLTGNGKSNKTLPHQQPQFMPNMRGLPPPSAIGGRQNQMRPYGGGYQIQVPQNYPPAYPRNLPQV